MGGGPRTFPGGLNKWQWWRQQKERRREAMSKRECALQQLDALRQRAEVLARRPELAQAWERLNPLPPPAPEQEVSQSSLLYADSTPSETPSKKKKKKPSLDEAALQQRSVRDYVDSFENDPLGVYSDICLHLFQKKSQ